MKRLQHFLFFTAVLLAPLLGWSQTNPAPFDLSTGDWTLTGWHASAGAGNYPGNGATGANQTTGVVSGAANANMVFWKHGTGDPAETTAESANISTNYTTGNGKINGKGTDGFDFNNTGSAGIGSACLAINTTGRSNITVTWTGKTSATGVRTYVIKLQYRVGTSGNFTDASGTITYTPGSSATLSSTLPAAAYNQPVVQILWRYYNAPGTTSGTRPTLGVDDITVSSSPACTGPTTAPSAFTATGITTTTATLGWTSGNGTARAVFLKDGAFTSATPLANTTYTADASFTGTGMAFDGGKTVYNNSGNSVAVTNLTPNTPYNAKVFEYLGAAGAECYNNTALSGNFTTVATAATATAATAINSTGFTANWTAPTGSAAYTYTLEVATDNAFTNIVSTSSGIAQGTLTMAVSALAAATPYYYRLFVVNAGGTSVASNIITVTTAPAAPPTPTAAVNPSCGPTTLDAYTGPASSTYYWQGTTAAGTSTTNPATTAYPVASSGTYYVRAYDNVNNLWSTASSIVVTIVANPAITSQPVDKSIGAGGNTSFSVTATNAGSYQWVVNTGNGLSVLSNGGVYSNVNTATLTITGATLAMNGYQYQVIIGAASPCTTSVTSNAATLTVTPTSAATDYFRSRATGLYGAASTWESSADSLTWINATAFPTLAAKSVTIRSADSVTVSSSGKGAAHLYVFGKLTLSGQDLSIADSSGYDAVIFSGGRFDCGTLNAGSEFFLPTGATVLVKTGGRITTRVSGALAGPGRGNEYFYEDQAILEYAGTQAIVNSGAVYFPTSLSGISPVFLFSKFPTAATINGNSPITFNGRVEFAVGAGVTWAGTGQKIFRDGLLNNGTIIFNNNTPGLINGTDAILQGSGTITLGTLGMNIASGATMKLLSDVTINSTSGALTIDGVFNTNGYKISGTAKFATAAGSTLIVTDAAGLTSSGTSGNIQTTGTRTFSTSGNYTYRGTVAQATGDGLPASSATLEIDNATGVTLSAVHTATTGLTLTSGNLSTTTTNLLSLGSAAVLTGGSASSYIDGPLKRATVATTAVGFPIGKAGIYAPVAVIPQSAVVSDYTAEYFTGSQVTPNRQNKVVPLQFVAANEYFDISRGTGADAQIILSYTSAAQVNDPATLVVAHYNGSQWVSEGGTATGTNASGTVISGNYVSSFSPFALGSTSSSQPLPIKLLSFNVTKKGTTAQLEWTLATTEGREKVMVERSADGHSFTALSSHAVSAKDRLLQSFVDANPLQGTNYYRLSMVDVDGAVGNSSVLSVRFDAVPDAVRIYPNPAKEVLHLEGLSTDAPANIRIYSATGIAVYSQQVRNANHAEVLVSGLADGLYWVIVTQDGQAVRRQIRIAR